ncbi:MAG: hypothetical protein AB1Z20_03080, partial [Desulfobacterales bacterium]
MVSPKLRKVHINKKVLVPKGEFDKRFLYHYLNTLKLPDNAGYSRHFKFLKEKAVVKPPLEEQ